MCTKYTSCNNCVVNRRAEVSENDTSSNGDVKMLNVFFRNQNCSEHTIFKTERLIHSHVYFLLSYYKQGSNSYNLGHPEYVIRTCLRYLKRHLLIITEALQTKKLNEINCPYSNDVNLFVDIIFTIPVHIEIRMSTALVKSGKSRPKLCLFRVYMHAIR